MPVEIVHPHAVEGRQLAEQVPQSLHSIRAESWIGRARPEKPCGWLDRSTCLIERVVLRMMGHVVAVFAIEGGEFSEHATSFRPSSLDGLCVETGAMDEHGIYTVFI